MSKGSVSISVSIAVLSLFFQLSANDQVTMGNVVGNEKDEVINQEGQQSTIIQPNTTITTEQKNKDTLATIPASDTIPVENTASAASAVTVAPASAVPVSISKSNETSAINSQTTNVAAKNTEVATQYIPNSTENVVSTENMVTTTAQYPSSKQVSISDSKNISDNNNNIVAIETPDELPTIDVKVDVEAPSYNHLVPVAGWNRYSGDSAGSLKAWGRWWQYLRMKTPVIMSWIDGLVVRIYPDNEIFRAIFVNGIYDPNSIVAVNSLLPKDGVFIDVGASFGLFSMLAVSSVGANGHIIAIEPSSRDYNRLVDNININDLGNSISAYHLAISNESGTALLNIATEERSALNTLGTDFSFKGVDKVAKETVDAISLDDFVVANQIKRIDVIKLDIEGSELKALQGSKKTIAKFHPVIMLGVNTNALKASGTDHDEIQRELSAISYKAYKLVDEEKLAFVAVPDLVKESAKIIFCFPEGVVPPTLPQSAAKSFVDKIKDFFMR